MYSTDVDSVAVGAQVASDSGPPPSKSVFERARLKQLFSVRGTQAEPVSSIVFSGLGLTGTQSIVLDPHGVPSGGDWSLSRSGALFLEGTESVVIERCVLQRLDGNGILLSGYNQHTNISHNTLVQTGATAIALWGDSSGTCHTVPLYMYVVELSTP